MRESTTVCRSNTELTVLLFSFSPDERARAVFFVFPSTTEEAKVARTFGEEMGHTGTLGGQAAVAVERQERNEMQGNRTEKHAGSSRADVSLNTVCLPRAVAPHVVPIILAFLYTDRFETYPENVPDGFAESYVDPGGAATATHAEEGGATAAGQVWSMLGRGIVSTGAGGGYCDHDNDDCGGEGQARAEAVVQVNMQGIIDYVRVLHVPFVGLCWAMMPASGCSFFRLVRML